MNRSRSEIGVPSSFASVLIPHGLAPGFHSQLFNPNFQCHSSASHPSAVCPFLCNIPSHDPPSFLFLLGETPIGASYPGHIYAQFQNGSVTINVYTLLHVMFSPLGSDVCNNKTAARCNMKAAAYSCAEVLIAIAQIMMPWLDALMMLATWHLPCNNQTRAARYAPTHNMIVLLLVTLLTEERPQPFHYASISIFDILQVSLLLTSHQLMPHDSCSPP